MALLWEKQVLISFPDEKGSGLVTMQNVSFLFRLDSITPGHISFPADEQKDKAECKFKTNLIIKSKGHHHLPTEQTELYYFRLRLPLNLKLVKRKERMLPYFSLSCLNKQ